MSLHDLTKYKTLGVINRTPNSFSDQGLSLNQDFFKAQLQSFLDDPTVIVDIGFESTAPMNSAITSEEEKKRFLNFLEESKEFNFEDRYVSFDTYRPYQFLSMSDEFKKIHPQAFFIMNDVSGILDDELRDVLMKFKGTNFYYIYTFSHIPDRDHVLNHMKMTIKEDIIQSTFKAFQKASEWFKELGMEKQLILDPGFGFSKSYEDNWVLINEFTYLQELILDAGISLPLLVGISKKSFLKKFIEQSVPVTEENLEDLHLNLLRKISCEKLMPVLYRVHDPKLFWKL